MKIGVLIPKSDMYPTLGMDLLNGLKLAITEADTIDSLPTFAVENIGVAVDDQVLKTAEKFILQEEVDLNIAFCGVHKLEELAKQHEGYQHPLIHLDFGGRVYRESHVNPFVIHHTLNIWQSSYAAGIHAAEKYGKKALIAASFYDGTYHMTEAFSRGFESGGGVILKYHVSPMDYKNETYKDLLQDIEEENPDLLYTSYSYKEGLKVMRVLANSKYNGKVPIMGIASMADESIVLDNLQLEKFSSVASWSFDATTAANKNFVSAYSGAYNKAPNGVSLLGYEVGKTIEICKNSEGKIPKKIMQALDGKTISSPRGPLKYNRFNECQVSQFLVRSFDFNKTGYHNNVQSTMEATFVEDLQDRFQELPYNGWQNPYLCT